jgi:uncharacterized protein (DUF305 family)
VQGDRHGHNAQYPGRPAITSEREDGLSGRGARIEHRREREVGLIEPYLRGTNMTGTDHSAGGVPGVMTSGQMQQLGQAKGGEFDGMFLRMMIGHHQGALEVANTELAQGASTEAKTLAQKIIDTQQAEITEMKNLLGRS